jgi:hypothetical protein
MLPILTHTDKSGPATGEELGQDFLASQSGLAPRSIGIKPHGGALNKGDDTLRKLVVLACAMSGLHRLAAAGDRRCEPPSSC